MTKRRKRTAKKSNKKNSFFYIKIISIALLLIVITSVASYFFYKKGYENGYERTSLIAQSKIDALKKENIILSEIKDYKNSLRKYKKKEEIKANKKRSETKIENEKIDQHISFNKPKLAIVIDDVAFGYQVKALKSLHLKINPSFFPPSKRHPNTPKYAKEFKFYMVHLPLEAKNFPYPEDNTLLLSSTKEDIEKRIKNVVKWFPDVRYINNHTGSAFTANKKAMERLIEVLNEYHIQFVDSRTTADTKVKEVEREFGGKYIARDIFLDNKQNVDYIRGQLKKAVKIAKIKGYAIAIGHPHPATIKALRESKDILKNVELVYVKQLF